MPQGPDPFAADEDLDAIADRALGLIDEMAEQERLEYNRRMRYRRAGAKLTARQVLSARRKRKFVQALAETGIVSRAATAAGWSLNTAHAMRKSDPLFAKAWADALEFAADGLEEEARRRAVDGTLRPVYQQGSLVGYVREYSDSLLTTMLKANKPDKFRENGRLEIDAKGGVLVVPATPTTPEEIKEFEKEAAAQQAPHRGYSGEEDPLA